MERPELKLSDKELVEHIANRESELEGLQDEARRIEIELGILKSERNRRENGICLQQPTPSK